MDMPVQNTLAASTKAICIVPVSITASSGTTSFRPRGFFSTVAQISGFSLNPGWEDQNALWPWRVFGSMDG